MIIAVSSADKVFASSYSENVSWKRSRRSEFCAFSFRHTRRNGGETEEFSEFQADPSQLASS